MAHLIEADNMVYAGDKPWHGIGEYLGVSDNASLESALTAKPILGSSISHTPALAMINGATVEVPDSFVAFRDFDGKALGIVGEQQRLSGASPKRLLQSLQNIVGAGKGCLHTAMYLREGKVFVATVKLGAPIEVKAANGFRDQTDFYLVATTSFDGSMRTALYETIVRVVCNNTLRASFSDRQGRSVTKIKHTRAHESKLNSAESEWSGAVQKYELFKRTVEILAKAPIADAQALELFKGALGLSADATEASTRKANTLETVIGLYHGGKGNAPFTGTAWGVLNALTEYADHRMIVRGARDGDGKVSDTSEDGRSKILDSALFGAGDAFKARALSLVSSAVGIQL